MDMTSFTDEMLKIKVANAGLFEAMRSAAQRVGQGLGGKATALAVPTAAVGGVLGWEQAKKMKRRYDIGKMVEDSQNRG